MENNTPYEQLKLENQLCFPLYACAKEVVRLYTPYLDPLGLTYTQYITMLVLWEKRQVSVKALGELLWLDSGTLTPLLKKLESKGMVTRSRSKEDERSVVIGLTEAGEALEKDAAEVPAKVGSCLKMPPEEAAALYSLLYKTLNRLNDSDGNGED
ncbi:MAG: MarR family transcriptional regulator [Ruminococcaceae bacterium]|jgi:DNA-binding MarR family transcriptional regulator|nr:MarR family transcriptional regulator [Oscillospiraceae bacterium]